MTVLRELRIGMAILSLGVIIGVVAGLYFSRCGGSDSESETPVESAYRAQIEELRKQRDSQIRASDAAKAQARKAEADADHLAKQLADQHERANAAEAKLASALEASANADAAVTPEVVSETPPEVVADLKSLRGALSASQDLTADLRAEIKTSDERAEALKTALEGREEAYKDVSAALADAEGESSEAEGREEEWREVAGRRRILMWTVSIVAAGLAVGHLVR